MIVDTGKGLKKFREELGLSRKEFYEKVGISRTRLSQLENNTYNESEKVITNILSHFDVGYYDFLVVYCGYKLNGKSFDSLDELREYTETRLSMSDFSPDSIYVEHDKIEYELERFLDNVDYLQTEASNDERNAVMDLIDFYKFKKYHKKDYQKWLVERSKEQK